MPPTAQCCKHFICAATLLNGSPESRYVTLVQRPVRLAVFCSIVKCPSWWKWPKESLGCWKGREQTHTVRAHPHPRARHNTVPEWNAWWGSIYPPNSTVLLTTLWKYRCAGPQGTRTAKGKVAAHPLPTNQTAYPSDVCPSSECKKWPAKFNRSHLPCAATTLGSIGSWSKFFWY